jgi:uncharacterized protein (TIGR02246 family)
MKKTFLTTIFTINFIFMLKAQDNKVEEQAIHKVLQTLSTGWNEKSGEKFASAFAEVHDYIVVNGLYFKAFTREQNGKNHQRLFDGVYKNAKIELKLDKINYYGNNLVHITAIGANYPSDQAIPEDPTVIMTMMVEKKPEGWKIISFHNHEINMEAIKRVSPMPVEVMYASWYKN